MQITQDEMSQRLVQFREALRRAGLKLTPQRMEVFREVAATAGHPDAETVYRGVRRRLPAVSLDTVYRTLWLLLDLGLIATLGSVHGGMRFDGNASPHHHFICTGCGAALDFTERRFDQLPVPEAVRAMGQVASAHVEFHGLCARCAGPPG